MNQLDNKIYKLKWYAKESIPGRGWINGMRIGLHMTLKQFGNRLGISSQGAKGIERREDEGAITIGKMEEIATALDMKFVYGFVPNSGSLKKQIEKQATELATKIVLQTSNNMSLEDQKISDLRIKKAIKERAEEIMIQMPKHLWD